MAPSSNKRPRSQLEDEPEAQAAEALWELAVLAEKEAGQQAEPSLQPSSKRGPHVNRSNGACKPPLGPNGSRRQERLSKGATTSCTFLTTSGSTAYHLLGGVGVPSSSWDGLSAAPLALPPSGAQAAGTTGGSTSPAAANLLTAASATLLAPATINSQLAGLATLQPTATGSHLYVQLSTLHELFLTHKEACLQQATAHLHTLRSKATAQAPSSTVNGSPEHSPGVSAVCRALETALGIITASKQAHLAAATSAGAAQPASQAASCAHQVSPTTTPLLSPTPSPAAVHELAIATPLPRAVSTGLLASLLPSAPLAIGGVAAAALGQPAQALPPGPLSAAGSSNSLADLLLASQLSGLQQLPCAPQLPVSQLPQQQQQQQLPLVLLPSGQVAMLPAGLAAMPVPASQDSPALPHAARPMQGMCSAGIEAHA